VILVRKNHARRYPWYGRAKGILTAVGGKSSHAAVVARGMGRPCIVGAGSISIEEHAKRFTVTANKKSIVVKEGEWISMDGTTAKVYLGKAVTTEPDPASSYFGQLMKWADEFRGGFGVRANADIPRDAKVARLFGAEGIGLCRTEHMFFAEDRIPYMQAMILARDVKSRTKALPSCSPCGARISSGCSRRWTDSRW
jgi:pyruvate,orthophosphate dikinase